jgi:hypothetical protein
LLTAIFLPVMSEDKRKNNPKLRYEALRRNLEESGIRDVRQQEFSLWIHSFCESPRNCVGEYSFKLVAAFLDGFDMALEVVYRDPARSKFSTKPSRIECLTNFGFWLGHKFKMPTNYVWRFYIDKHYPDDASAFEALPQLYDEFLIMLQSPKLVKKYWSDY